MKICLIGGDGIGPEVVTESVRLLTATGIKFTIVEAEAGYGAYQRQGSSLPPATISRCKQADAILFGAVTTPPQIPNYFSPIVKLRKELGLFANVRPFFSLPIKKTVQNLDIILVRENTEDLYVGQERLTPEGAVAERVITRKACRQVVDFAFKLAEICKIPSNSVHNFCSTWFYVHRNSLSV